MTARGSESQVRALRRGYRTATVLSLVLAPTLVLLVAIVMFASLQGVARLRSEEEVSYERQAQMQRVFSLVQDAETGQRGFVITGAEEFLQPYDTAMSELQQELGELEAGVAGEPAQMARMQRLRQQIARKVDLMASGVAARRYQGLDAATTLVTTGHGKRAMDEIRGTVGEMLAAEAAALRQRQLAAHRRERQAELVSGVLLALVMANLLAAALLVRRQARSREAVLSALEQQSARREAIFESAMDAVVTLNPSGTIETINTAAERLFGYERGELVRRDCSVIVDLAPGEGLFLHRLGAEAGRDLGVAREFTGRRRDGSTFPAEISLGAVKLQDGVYVVATIRDVSERKASERLKDEFVSTVSHELRTPLTSIAGSLGLLDAGAAGELPEKAKRLIYIARTSTDRLVRLINDLLDIQKISTGKIAFDMRPLDLRTVAERAAQDMTGFAGERQVRIELVLPEQPLTVTGDLDRLIQILSNLLSNAVKFSPEGGLVTLTVEQARGRACVRVADQGPGVPEAFQPALFGRFAQADGSSQRSAGGSGLGLAISREIAERHRGALRLAESTEAGASFLLELPLGAEPEARAQECRVLLCEDDDHAAEVITAGLRLDGFQVERARTLATAEEALEKAAFDALVLDLHLPDGHGLSLVRRLREHAEHRRLPVVVVTGDALAGMSSMPVADWIVKPVDLGRLRDSVLAAIAGRRDLDILHVDDDADLAEVARASLAGAGRVRTAATLAAARRAIRARRPDLIILDVGLPDGSGLDLLADLSAEGPQTPVIVYSGQEIDEEMVGRVQAVLTKSRVSFGALADTVRSLTASRENA
ncbi:CHASE3 domain-containing protein [Phenylobacterium sp.]|uniref:CHASE3 domain-containing protein n=1 Tax=Phenylobacterium sp. TaxID=1871053 RepID=UPI0035AE3DB0